MGEGLEVGREGFFLAMERQLSTIESLIASFSFSPVNYYLKFPH